MYILSNIWRICACKILINFTKEIIKKIKKNKKEMYIPFIKVELLFIVASFTRIIAWMYSVKERKKEWKQSAAVSSSLKMSATVLGNLHTLSHSIFTTPLRGSYDYLLNTLKTKKLRPSC